MIKNKKLDIIILNWNGKKVTEDCINSLNKQTLKNFNILIVDNASIDGSLVYLKKKFPKIKIIKSKKNLGYAEGNNFGLRHSKSKYVLLLNNDVILDKNFINELWKNKDKADILGVKSYYYDNKDVLWSVGSKINKYTMKASLVGKNEKDIGQYDEDFSPEQITGVAMMINRKVFDKTGYFNEGYFCYYEESEWQTRAKNLGFKISWVPTAKLWHRVGFSTGGGRTPTSSYYLIRNRGYFIKEYGRHKLVAFSHWFIDSLARILYGLIKMNLQYSKMSFYGIRDFLLDRKGDLTSYEKKI